MKKKRIARRKYKRGGGINEDSVVNNTEAQPVHNTAQQPSNNLNNNIKNKFSKIFGFCNFDIKLKFISAIIATGFILFLISLFTTSFPATLVGFSCILVGSVFAWGLYTKTFMSNGNNNVNMASIIKMLIPLLLVIPCIGIEIYLNSTKEKTMNQLKENLPYIGVMNAVAFILLFIYVIFMITFYCKSTKIGDVIFGNFYTIIFFILSLFSTLLSITVLQKVNSFATDG